VSLPVVVALLLIAGSAAAERAIAIDVTGTPFAAADLTTALRARTAGDGAPVHLRVIAIAGGRAVRIESLHGVREVDLGDARGPAAARLVALVATDLIDELAPVSIASEPRPVARADRGVQIAALAGIAGWSDALGSLAIDVVIPRDGWLLAFQAGGGQLLGGQLGLEAAVLRAELGGRLAWVEIRAGAVALPILVTTGRGDSTVLIGGGISARARLPLTAGLRGVVATGVDGFATTTEYRLNGAAALVTPRWAPWLAAGIEVGL